MLNCNSLSNFIPSSVLSLFQNTVQWLRYNEGTELTVHGCTREALCSLAQIRGWELTPTNRNGQMNLSLGETAKRFTPNFFDKLHDKIGKNPVIPCPDTGMCKRNNEDPYIEWDNSCVINTDDKIFPHTTMLGPCIGILIRAYHRCDLEYPAYLSVTHAYTHRGITEFESSLEKLIKNTDSAGIEIFLCGGWNKEESDKEYVEYPQEYGKSRHLSNSMYDEILRIVKKHEVRIMQDVVGLADAEADAIGKVSKEELKAHFGIWDTGFDRSCNPYAVVNIDTIGIEPCTLTGTWRVRPVPKSK